ncbi:MAG: hypothetical protein FWG30_10665 [Eubacteriaceae bacterium]|nr:hypothetical protein [Eubacteriaceae bacterium]
MYNSITAKAKELADYRLQKKMSGMAEAHIIELNEIFSKPQQSAMI